ncbi:phosphotransferase [Roseobacter sp. YSTF-M11]|uniref:Phosphotransferase n=1 Tax=Roseobacter insulae TaxID=2859783 RepID=A0A9X1FSI9_9RHOB|nr:phosphotransferase [Roseobacter insulae]MBW4706697.1 phosphotransferase [Roseobacter insulae]
MTARSDAARTFLARAGWSDAEVTTLAGDASNRRYDRLTKANGDRAVLMDAPPDKGEKILPFVRIAAHLSGLGLSAPRVLAQDDAAGFLLLEDLGDDLFARIMKDNPQREEMLYAAAVDVLTHVHHSQPPSLVPYDAKFMTPLAALAFDWFQFGATGQTDTKARSRFTAEFEALLTPLADVPQVLVQRDFHAENLLWLPDRAGPARVGLLDFQDAMLGHPAYDLMSVLQDARRDVAALTEAAMIDRYLAQNPQDPAAFKAAYALLGAQRNLRIMGGFSRLCMRNGKVHYIDLIPRVWAHVMTNLKHPALGSVAQIITDALPVPTPEVLTTLRSKCATYPDR